MQTPSDLLVLSSMRAIRETSANVPLPRFSEEFAGLSCVGFRRAVRFIDAVEGTEQVVFYTPFNVVRDVEIKMTIVIVVEPCAAGTETLGCEYRRLL